MLPKLIKILILFLLTLLPYSTVLGQESFYRQLTEEDGLPSMTIYQVHQDKKGFMWFGTENGISRYDGREMKTYYHPELLDNEILTIQEDSWGRIWFKNLAGQLAFIDNDQVEVIQLEEGLDFREFCILEDYLVGLFRKDDRRTLIKYRVTPKGKLTIEYRNHDAHAHAYIQSIQKRGEEMLFYSGRANRSSVQIFNVITNELKELEIADFDYKSVSFNKIFLFEKNSFIHQTRETVQFLKIESDSIIEFNRSDITTPINDYFYWNQQLYFVGEGGVIKGKSKLSIFPPFKFNTSLVDQEENIWLGTKDNGVVVIPSLSFLNYTMSNSNLRSNSVYCIAPYGEDKILIGQDEGNIGIIGEQVTNKKIHSTGRVKIIEEGNENEYWVGGEAPVPLMFLSSNLSVLKTLNLPGVKNISVEANQYIWLARSSLVNRLPIEMFTQNPNSKEIEYLGNFRYKDAVKEYKIEQGILRARVTSAIHTAGMTWLGSTKGIYRFHNEEFQPFLENGEQVLYSVSDIIQTKDSTIWLSTQGHGILGIQNDSIIHRLDETKGLITNNCSDLFYDEYNNLWIGTKKGLHRLNLNTFKIDLINNYDGMPTDEIAAIYAKDSTLWLGTRKGLLRIPYAAIHKNTTPPPIHIMNIALWERDTTLLPTYNLEYNQNNLNVEFVGLTYRNQGNTTYEYRMLGLDTNWVNTTARFARYPSLPPGGYEFQVKAINEDGVSSILPAKVEFYICKPWWQTWWFYLVTFLGLVGVIGGFFYQRFRRIQKEERQQREINEKFNALRMMALQAQMNPHFVFNALSAIQKFLTTEEHEQAMIYLARFAQLIRSIFEQSKEQLITLDEEFEFLKLYLDLEKLRFKNKVKVNFEIDRSIQEDDYDLRLPPLLIQPIVENAFKHGLMHKEQGGILQVLFSKDAEFLVCVIEDNGVGRQLAEKLGENKLRQQKSSGLKTAKERLTILNQPSLDASRSNDLVVEDLLDKNQNPIGTRVTLKIKYNN